MEHFQTILTLFLQNLNFLLKYGMSSNIFVISVILCWKALWTTDEDKSTIICSSNIYYNTNVHNKKGSVCVCVVMGCHLFLQQSKQDKAFLCDCI